MKRVLPAALAALVGVVSFSGRAGGAETPAFGPSIRAVRLTPHVPAGSARLGAVPAGKPLTIEVALTPSHPDRLDALLRGLYDPASPRYRHWLSPAEFAREFAPAPALIGAVTQWLHTRGLPATSVAGSIVRATGSAGAVANALGVAFSRYRLADGTLGDAADSAPLVPSSLAASITAIVGLSDTVRFRNALDTSPRRFGAGVSAPTPSVPTACADARAFAQGAYWTPDQVSAHYGVPTLVHDGLDGRGTKIAILSLGPSRASDTAAYLACFGLHNKVTAVKVDGGATADEFATLEAEVDIEAAATNAPGAAIVSYEGPNSGPGEFDLLSRIVSDDVAVVSTSWGSCESDLQSESPGYIDALHVLFQQAAAQGESVFAAAGDLGSEDCYDPSVSVPDDSLQVDSPADDPFVTGVGGSSLEPAGPEVVWNDCEASVGVACAQEGGGAGGGGQSTIFPRPIWQPRAPGAPCANCRGVPDIAANAGVGEVFSDSDFGDSHHLIGVGGSSVAAPTLAGMAADIASGCTTGRIGDFAPSVDALAAQHVDGTALRDITKGVDPVSADVIVPGDNDVTRSHARNYATATGFDLASGIGTPLAPGLACTEVTALTPTWGTPGMHVVVHGVGLERAHVYFGSTPAVVLAANSTSATVVVPPGAGGATVSGSSTTGVGPRRATFGYARAGDLAYRTVDATGGVFSFGGAAFYGATAGRVSAPMTAAAVDHATGGYWLVSARGDVVAFHAPAVGDLAGSPPGVSIVGIAATGDGKGYWLAASDGRVFAFGTARLRGSAAGVGLNQPIVGIAATPDGGGYWLVARDGGIFAFGTARFRGSTGGIRLNSPIVGMAAAPGGGYRLVASDGGVFAFGAPFYGSAAPVATARRQSITGIAGDTATGGYWLVASSGTVYAFHAPFAGSASRTTSTAPMVAVLGAH